MSIVRLSGQVIWQDWNGRGGVQFIDVPKASRKLLDEFLGAHLSTGERKREFFDVNDVTVVMEQPAGMSVISREGSSHHGKTAVAEEITSPATVSQTTSDSTNRRAQTRYGCRVGAEVYRTGTSVPNHCCLTDLSSGGCYLEVPLPFPPGSSVEILVRTHEMKLRLRGTVQASHPGYGMGVAFELKTKEEQSNVNKLTNFVASTQTSGN